MRGTPPSWEFWIDRGGTFTDVIGRDPRGRLHVRKLLSDNPEHYADAAIAGIAGLLDVPVGTPLPADRIGAVKMGTTVGTNALLTRSGEPTLLLVSEGFADQLVIGDQSRPDIFALRIDKPRPLYARVAEVAERLDAAGEVVRQLDRDRLAATLAAARADGLNACAIAFLHSWRNPQHELIAGDLAAAAGFRQISLSHRVSPLPRFLPRAETAVLDATLGPPLRRYVDSVAADLPAGTRLEFMQSNGGLVAADAFHGRDSVLSGPAGGLIGMIKAGQAAGFDRLIGFDMGGTSTDVSLYAGAIERRPETVVAGSRIRTPMLAVHTVAAGGGSLLRFADGRLMVGPDSAGSLPGPCAYRRGGALAVTDANLLLGRLQADFFPPVFGPDAAQPLDTEAVATAFASLAGQLNAELGLDYAPEDLAEGFLAVAVENMADAVRHITLQRGVDPAAFVLVSFGGAGGQLACRVAAALDIGRVLVSPYASVLSAYGIGLAEHRRLHQVAVEAPLDDALAARLADLAADATGDTRSSHVRVLLRRAGTDTALSVTLDDRVAMEAAFHAGHHARFGYSEPGQGLVCAAIEIEEVSGGASAEPCPPAPTGAPPLPRRLYIAGAWQEDVPLYLREALCVGQTIDGPALIVEPTSCTVVEPGWTAILTERGDLLLEAHRPVRSRPDPAHPDPAWLALFGRRFMSIAEDMGQLLQNTARSVNIRERLDFSCALFDRAGDLIANAPHIPVHLGSMGEAVRTLLERFHEELRAGDAYLINSPYAGGTHLPDITVVRPVFDPDGRELRYVTAARAHHADIGGCAPGSMPADSTRIDQEGCLSDGLRIVAGGRFLDAEVRAWLTHAPLPARDPEQNLADLRAQLAACTLGEQLLRRLEDEVGAAAVPAYMGYVQDNAEAAVVRLLGRLRDGCFHLPLDDLPEGIRVAVRVDAAAGRALIDFTGSSGPHGGNLNAPSAIVRSAVLYVFRCLLDVDIPLNAGVLRPLDIRLPSPSLLAPEPPAAVVAGNVETSQNIVDALFGALGVLAAGQGTMNNLSFGDTRHQYYETICGGTGAGRDFDGTAAVHCHMTNSRLTDPEIIELKLPVRVERFAIRHGSGGNGRHRGGDGVRRELRFLAPVQANLIALRRRVPPFGLAGGAAGATGRQWIERRDGHVEPLPGIAGFQLDVGDLLIIETPGGGGFGTPAGDDADT